MRWLVAHAAEQDRTHPVFAVAAVIIILAALTIDLVLAPPWLVFAIGNGPTIDIVAEETGGIRNRRINLRIHDARLFTQHNGELNGQSGRVDRAIGSDRTTSPFSPAAGRLKRRKPVAGRAAQIRVFGRVDDILAEPGQHLGVTRQQVVFCQKDTVVVMPCITTRDITRRHQRPGMCLDHRHILGIAGCHQGQRADGRTSAGLAPSLRVDPLCEILGGVGHDQRGFGTIVGHRIRVGAHERQGDGHIGGNPGTPALDAQDSVVAGLGVADRPAHALARVGGEERHGIRARACAQNHVVNSQHPGGRSAGGYAGHQNLIGSKQRAIIIIHGRRPGVINPPAHPGRPQVPSPGAVECTEIRGREVRRLGSQQRWHDQQQRHGHCYENDAKES